MRYFILKNHVSDEGIPIRISARIEKLCAKMARLSHMHAQLDRVLVKTLAELNSISQDEASDIMCAYDFLVDQTQYGLSNFSNDEVSKVDWNKLQKSKNKKEE